MSVKIMSAVFESETLGPTERLIMLALADHADDEGRCYPSIARLCKRTGLKERAIQGNLKSLCDQGYLTIIPNAGPNGVNLFFVRATPAPDAPPQQMRPRTKCAYPPQQMRLTPAADAPKPSGTINEPSEEGSDDPLSSVDDEKAKAAAQQIKAAFGAYNDAAVQSGWPRAQAMTPARKSGIAARLRQCGGLDGWLTALSKAQASPHCCGQNDRGWVADLDFIIQPKSFTRLMEGFYDNRTPAPRAPQSPNLRQNRPDPALEDIARIVGLGAAPGYGRG